MTVTGRSSMRSAEKVELAHRPRALDRGRPRVAWIRGRWPSTVRGVNAVEHQPPEAGVVGRLHVDELVALEVPERVLPRGRLRPAPLRGRRHVEVGPAQTPVAQERVHVARTALTSHWSVPASYATGASARRRAKAGYGSATNRGVSRGT